MAPARVRIWTLCFLAGVPIGVTMGCSGADGGPDPTGQTSDQVVGGSAARGRDPAVIAVDVGGQGLCSGTLIAPRVVLTARHCVSQTVRAVTCPSSQAQIQSNYAPSALAIRTGDDFTTGTVVARGRNLVVPNSNKLCENDIAAIILDRTVTGITPASVDLDRDIEVGDQLQVIGYGKLGDNVGAGQKYIRDNVPLVSLTDSEFHVGEAVCGGDSGGPAIKEATGKVVGVVSRGGSTCQGSSAVAIYTRTASFSTLVRTAMNYANSLK